MTRAEASACCAVDVARWDAGLLVPGRNEVGTVAEVAADLDLVEDRLDRGAAGVVARSGQPDVDELRHGELDAADLGPARAPIVAFAQLDAEVPQPQCGVP